MKYDVFKNTACMMHMGNMTKDFVPVGKEEQAEIKEESNCAKVGDMCFSLFVYTNLVYQRLLSSSASIVSG